MPFTLFGTSHIIVILITVLLSFATYFQNRLELKNRTLLKNILALLLATQIIVFNSWHLFHQDFNITQFLPFHLCTISAYISVFALLFEKQILYKLQFFWGLIPATIAFLLPDMGAAENFPNFRFIEFFWSHSLIITTSFWIIFGGKMSLKYKDVWNIFGILISFAFGFVYWINQYLGSNYMYLSKRTSGGQMNFLPREPYHIFGLLGIFLIVFHLQFWIWKFFNPVSMPDTHF